ncbi:hypothetical protein JCGZ_15229 [Jatropha curcas]|uniref:Uncharacterized protein n=1 Tax=Jatropha curcas TaxID=180498 RepID=A0A067KHG5_JATCU|nr:hypothetical protein JCGZ_15229 [Jatropha curcas]
MCLLEGLTREDLEVEYRGFSANDFLSAGDFPSYFASRMQARLPEVFEYTQERKTHKTAAHYRAEAAAEADRSMAYFPDRISRQYGMIERVPRVHNFESGLITSHLLTNLAGRWRNRNTVYLDEGTMQDTVTPAYVNWFLPHNLSF